MVCDAVLGAWCPHSLTSGWQSSLLLVALSTLAWSACADEHEVVCKHLLQ